MEESGSEDGFPATILLPVSFSEKKRCNPYWQKLETHGTECVYKGMHCEYDEEREYRNCNKQTQSKTNIKVKKRKQILK